MNNEKTLSDLKTIALLYQKVKQMVLLVEFYSSNIFLSSLNEFRNALDHIMRAFLKDSDNSEVEFKSALQHLKRGYFDSYELLIVVLFEKIIDTLKPIKPETIIQIFPKYYSEIRPFLDSLRKSLKAKKDIIAETPFDENLDEIEGNALKLIEYYDEITLHLPLMLKVNRKQKFNWLKGLIFGFIASIIMAFIVYLISKYI